MESAAPNMDQATVEAGKLAARETDTHIYFFGYDTGSKYDCFQQWYPSRFIEPALSDSTKKSSGVQEEEEGLDVFPTSEHYMMAMKARIFRDEETAEKITKASTPAQAKSLGREVRNFNQQIWDAACDSVVERGNWLKFGQNEHLAEILLSTGDKEIVEASPSDKIWGVGFDVNNAEGNERHWGANKLGKALMRVRHRIRSGEKEGDWPRIVKLEGCTSCGSCGKPHDNLKKIAV